MATDLTSSNELADFHRFLSEKLENAGCRLSPEQALDEWRSEHPFPEELAESVAALKVALAEADSGQGKPVDEVIAEIRRRIETTRKT